MDDTQSRYQAAKARVEALRGFYIHLTVYIVVNIGLFLIDTLATPGNLWFFWPLAGWGIAVAIHGLSVLGRGRWLGAEWEERKIREQMEAS